MAEVLELVYSMKDVNPGLLHEEMGEALGEALIGVSWGPVGVLRVHVRSAVDGVLRAKADGVIAAHDARGESKGQRERRLRREAVGRLRKPWAEWTQEDKDAYLGLLAAAGVGLAEEGV